MDNPFLFPIQLNRSYQQVIGMPQVGGSMIKGSTVTVYSYAEGNSVTTIQSYSIMLYDAAGRLDAYNHRSNYIDLYI